MFSRFGAILLGTVLLFAIGMFVAFDDAEATGKHFICYHNAQPYALVFLYPGQSAPVCPVDYPTWDAQDDIDSQKSPNLEAPAVPNERHIDCEFTVEPGDL